MVSELRKRHLRDTAAAELQDRWGTVRPEALHEVTEDLRARVVEERLLDRPGDAVAAVKQSLAANAAWGHGQGERELSQERLREQEFDTGCDR